MSNSAFTTTGIGSVTASGNNDFSGNNTFDNTITISALTASQIVATDGSKNLQTLTVATYPSLTELSYVKGVTSALQTQLNGKQASGTYLTSVAVASSNGFAGSSSGGATPTITLTTSITGIPVGNGTSFSASSVTNDAQTKAAIVPNTAPTAGQILVGNAGGTAYAPNTVSGSGATITLSSAGVITVSAIANASLSNSTISGVALGGTLAALTATDSTLTFSGSYTGTTARTVGLNLGQANTWTATQTQKCIVDSNNAITASGNAATVPITNRLNTVTNNSAATLTITMTTTSAVDGQMSIVRVLDSSAAAQTIAWVNTENSTVSAPTTSNGSTTLFLTVGFIFNGGTSKWRCIASA